MAIDRPSAIQCRTAYLSGDGLADPWRSQCSPYATYLSGCLSAGGHGTTTTMALFADAVRSRHGLHRRRRIAGNAGVMRLDLPWPAGTVRSRGTRHNGDVGHLYGDGLWFDGLGRATGVGLGAVAQPRAICLDSFVESAKSGGRVGNAQKRDAGEAKQSLRCHV